MTCPRAFPAARWVLLTSLAAACGAAPRAHPESPAAAPARQDAPAHPAAASEVAAGAPESAPELSAEDCKAFDAAPALGVAVVVESQPDCSSVGHRRIVLEVRRLVRGSDIALVGTSRTLFSHDEPRLEVGETVLAAIEPELAPADTVYCVSLPERQGSLRHAVKVESIRAAEPLLDAIANGRCGAPR